ncbi:hypothetical protein U9M48_031280, partial [Paspalum notatum var. saurae]
MGCCHHKEQDLPPCSLIRALMCTMEDVPTPAPAAHNVKDTMEDALINTDMSRSPFYPPSLPIDVVPIVAVEFFMAAPNSQCERPPVGFPVDGPSPPYYAEANGQAEASNKSLIKLIKKKIDEYPKQWHDRLAEALWAYRMSCHGATKCTPYQLVYGQEAVMPWE